MRKSKNFVLGINDDQSDKHKSLRSKFHLWKSINSPKKAEKEVSFWSLFRYSSSPDKALIFLGIVSSFLGALGMPLVIILYGDFVTLLVDRAKNNQTLSPTPFISWLGGGRTSKLGDEEDLAAAMREDSIAWVFGCLLCGTIQFVFSFASILLLNFTSLKQSAKIRRLFLRAVLRQDMSWFDVNNANSFASKVSEDLNRIQEGMGDKIGLFLFLVLTFLTSLVMAFCQGWKLTLVVCVCSPLIVASIAYVGKIQTRLTDDELKAYGRAGSVAQEVLSSIKTVMAFGGENKEIERYASELESSRRSGIRRGCYTGLGAGISSFIIYCCYSLAFWYGTTLVLKSAEENDTEYTPAVIIMVFYGVLAGAINLGQATPHLEAFASAKGAARSIFAVMERIPEIDSLSPKGKVLSSIRGEITIRNVSFRYPARPETEVLKGVDIRIKEGEMVAVVGSSGSGKSTLLQLLQRLYDPTNGSVLLDGENVKDLNVSWFRRQMAVVGQEPSLFAATIYDNISYGMENATENDVESAAKLANAHDFIMKLPKKYNTVLGERGTQLSGGQKQRIAIARAIIRNPKILLLDEATSALDAVSERTVQAALDKAAKGRTTVIVTHKLSNITKVDRIIVMSEGRIVEQGTHDELISNAGLYFTLSEMQSTNQPVTTFAASREENFRDDVERRLSLAPKDFTKEFSPEEVSDAEEDTVDKAELQTVSIWRMLKYNKPEWWHMFVGWISALLVGGCLPVVSIILGEIYGLLSGNDPDWVMSQVTLFCILFLIVAVVCGSATFLQNYTFNYAGAQLTYRLRKDTFASILRQEAGWFDEENHNSGILCARLSGDASAVHGLTGSSIGVLLQSLSTLIIGIIISFFFTWKMTLVTLTTVPIVFLGTYLESKVVFGQNLLEKKALEKSAKGAMEGIVNIRTVASLGREQAILDRFGEELKTAERTMYIKSVMRAFAFAMGQTSPFFSYGLSLWFGSRLVAEEGLPYKNIFKVTEALLFGAWTLAHALASAPNFTRAKMSAARILNLIEREPNRKSDGIHPREDWKADGRVSFSKVRFAYPTRPDFQVLDGFDLIIRNGLSVALVGQSGCGKSTVIQLLQRLYYPSDGRICLDEQDISQVDVDSLRKQFAIVSQEPVLFDRTIEENIAYGDNSRTVSRGEVIAAAKSANIHDFISCLPLGYETRLGSGGGQLSGGQKQRIAIARALVRNPRILLLDEATSALDPANESVVQAALDQASEGRTTITVGHKLTAVQRADLICFIDKGRIVECGTHEQLLLANGKYAEMLYHNQTL